MMTRQVHKLIGNLPFHVVNSSSNNPTFKASLSAGDHMTTFQQHSAYTHSFQAFYFSQGLNINTQNLGFALSQKSTFCHGSFLINTHGFLQIDQAYNEIANESKWVMTHLHRWQKRLADCYDTIYLMKYAWFHTHIIN